MSTLHVNSSIGKVMVLQVFAILTIMGGSALALVNPGDISFDSDGQLRVAGWLQMNEINYNHSLSSLNNTVTNSGANFVEYSNANLTMRKDWTLVDDVLRITMQVTPNAGNGETSVVETRLDFAAESRVFSHWFQPETGSHPTFTGQILAAHGGADWDIGFGGSTGWEAGAVFVGPSGSFMFDRIEADGFSTLAAGPDRVAADLGEADYLLFSRHFAEWSAAQTTFDENVRDNQFSLAGNTVTYELRFYSTTDSDEAIKLASQDYYAARKSYW